MGSSSSKNKNGALIGTPTMTGTMTTPLFNGLLLRIIDERTGTWGFYSNTEDYEFHIFYLFGVDSTLEPFGQTTMTEEDDGIMCEMTLYPLETKKFVQGDVSSYECKIEARPLSEEYFQSHPKVNERKYYRRLVPPKAKSF
ncbi:calpain-like cysteine peptidase, Clan CA, family C2 [Trypanosoma theileri]|uniref:Calpain-like cysteine peptidase, Clan CA, family C2 n=1 Tax=Trypanosoma theileri TaxID=67003 RepID=A0A1X0NWH2_9TRYP|nr:calpain-like cysteine peptidase, Clan CA, family C2 [Trypanosoma theileri]ORC88961.1 calpain-like cysteine peptidase, Clan CA, family C2 [Trypanosoma theileri]